MIDAQTGQLVNDPELIGGNLDGTGLPPGGSWSITITYTGLGQIALPWTNQMKTPHFLPVGLGPFTFYVEGKHESSKLDDTTLTFTYTANGQQFPVSAYLTITPVINGPSGFTVKPAGGANGQNINFINQVNGTDGLKAFIPGNPNTAGASFTGSLTVTALNGNPVFIQNYIDAENGANGTKVNGNPVGYTFAAGWIPPEVNVTLIDGKFPVLDTDPRPPNPEYLFDLSVTNDGNTATIKADDSPSMGVNPPNVGHGITLDVLSTWKLWLVWKYPSGIYWPLALINWQANWYAFAVDPNLLTGPVNHIQIPHGVTADANYTRSNDTPDRMLAPVFNQNNQWVAS
jgi:hypothetical protein